MKRRAITFNLLLIFAATTVADSVSAQSRDRRDGNSSNQQRNSDANRPDTEALFNKLRAAVEKGEMSRDRAREVQRLITFYVALDTDGDMILDPKEYEDNRSRESIARRIRDAGMDPSKPIKLSEFMARRLENAGIQEKQIKIVSDFYTKRRKTSEPRGRVTIDLQNEYLEFDFNMDNQIGMYEWPRADRSTFLKIDRNNDGFVTPREIKAFQSRQDAEEN